MGGLTLGEDAIASRAEQRHGKAWAQNRCSALGLVSSASPYKRERLSTEISGPAPRKQLTGMTLTDSFHASAPQGCLVVSLSDGKQVPFSSHREDRMVQCFSHHQRGKQAAVWIYGTAGLQATRPEVLHCSRWFPASPSTVHFSSRILLLLQLQSSGPSNAGVDITRLKPPSFCKTISSTLVCLGDFTDVPKKSHQLRLSFPSCHPCLAASRS